MALTRQTGPVFAKGDCMGRKTSAASLLAQFIGMPGLRRVSLAVPLCLFICLACENLTAANPQPWPGESWNTASNLTSLGPSGFPNWNSNLSSAYWNPLTRRLWLANNSGVFTVLKENSSGGFTNERNYYVSGVSTQTDLEGITQALNTNRVYLMHERWNVIREYNVSTGATNQSWNLSSLIGNVQNDGTEGIAFIPDSWLAASGFCDSNGTPYTQSAYGPNGLGGIMLVAVQHFSQPTTGYVYAVDLNTNGTWTTVGRYKTASRGDSCDLAFDSSIGRLYILHNSTDATPQTNILEITDLTSAPCGADRKFTTLNEFQMPGTYSYNLEGFAVTPALTSSNTIGDKWCFITDDGAANGALRWFKQVPSPISISAGNNQSADPSSPVSTPPSVLVQDAFQNPLPDFVVKFTVTNGGGSVVGGTATTGPSGIATVESWTLGPTPGSNALAASGIGLSGCPVVFNAYGTDSEETNTLTVAGPEYGRSDPDYGTYTGSAWTVFTVTVTNSPVFEAGTQYVCTAAAVTGNSFIQVSPTRVVLALTNNATLTWQWQRLHQLTVLTNGDGTVTVTNGWYLSGSNMIMTANASPNWHFDGWNGDTNGCGIVGNVITAAMTSARSITAMFGIDRHALAIVSDHGEPSPPVGTYTNDYGTELTNSVGLLDVQGNIRFVCTGWIMTGNIPTNGQATNMTVILTNNATLTWQWKTQYRLDIVAEGNSIAQWLDAGSSITLIADNAPHWHFDSWSGDTNDCTISGGEITIPMDGPRSLEALFAVDQHLLTVNSSFGGEWPGSVTTNYNTFIEQWVTNSPAPGSNGTQYVCIAASVAGCDFSQVATTNITLNLTNDSEVTWLWETNSWIAGLTNGDGTIIGAAAWVCTGSNVTLQAVTSPYSYFAGWSGDIGPQNTGDVSYTVTMDQSRTLTANFADRLATNGTPWRWLAQYYPDTNDFDAAELSDTDGDRMKAWEEYRARTQPTNALSMLRITFAQSATSQYAIAWSSVTGRTYSVHMSTNLVEGWPGEPLTNNMPADESGTTAFGYQAQSNVPAFYRVSVE